MLLAINVLKAVFCAQADTALAWPAPWLIHSCASPPLSPLRGPGGLLVTLVTLAPSSPLSPLSPLHVQAASDIRADPMLNEACKDDTESLCKTVKKGGGRVQACLVGGYRWTVNLRGGEDGQKNAGGNYIACSVG